MRDDPAAGGAVPALNAQDMAAVLPQEAPDLVMEEICNLPSSHFTLDTLVEIRDRVSVWVEDPAVDGVVVTHGTDTMEETAYLLDLTVPGEKPMVLTGAMRTASEPGWDGPANLWAAVRVAASPQARGLGALVVLNDQIHAARFVTKTDTLSPSTFQSPAFGPLGRVEGDRVHVPLRLEREVLDWRGLEQQVELLKLTLGARVERLEDCLARGVRGVVLEGLGAGRIPPWWLPAISRAIAGGVAVVVGSRCPGGRIWDPYGYTGGYRSLKSLGCLFAPHLNGQKTRLRLMVVLEAARLPREVAELWNGGYTVGVGDGKLSLEEKGE
jgi:L-asparaginase